MLNHSVNLNLKQSRDFEWSLNSKGRFGDFTAVMQEYMNVGHAELVPVTEQEKPEHEVFYLPQKIRAVPLQSPPLVFL